MTIESNIRVIPKKIDAPIIYYANVSFEFAGGEAKMLFCDIDISSILSNANIRSLSIAGERWISLGFIPMPHYDWFVNLSTSSLTINCWPFERDIPAHTIRALVTIFCENK